MFGFASLLWISGALGQVTVTPTSPYLETFDGFTVETSTFPSAPTSFLLQPTSAGWTNLTNDNFDWYAYSDDAPSGSTGPNADFTTCGTNTCTNTSGTGVYLYCESGGSATAGGSVYNVESPTFDISALSSPTLSFYYHMTGARIGKLEVIVDNGVTETVALTISGQQQSAESDPWRQQSVLLCGYGSTVSVQFKYTTGTNGDNFQGDAAIDQVEVFEAAAAGPDLELASVNSPVGGGALCGNYSSAEQVNVTIKNNTCATFDFSATPVVFTISGTGSPAPSGTFTLNTGTLPANGTQDLNIGSVDLSSMGTYNMTVNASMTGDGNTANNEIDGLTFVNTGGINTFPYSEDFENGAGGWQTQGTTSFEIGTPDGSEIDQNAPGGGTQSWITNADGPYNTFEDGAVLSPCFDFSGISVPAIQFDAWWDSERGFDGAALQYSFDGRSTWNLLGELNDSTASNWYNDGGISSGPGGQSVGWSNFPGFGTGSGPVQGWTAMEYDVSFLGGEPSVLFRFAFASDVSVQYDGFAFDNFSILEIPPVDASVSAIDPASVCPGTNSVFVTVTNKGSKILNSVNITATVDGTPTSLSGRRFPLRPGLRRNETQVINVGTASFMTGTNYTIVATAVVPNDLFPANDVSTLTKEPSLSGTYSVGSGGDYADITAAIAALNNLGVCGPTVFEIAAGTYAGSQYSFGSISGASDVNTITFKPAAGPVVVEYASPGFSDNYIFDFDGAGWITLDGLTLSNTGVDYSRRIQFSGNSEGITIQNCTLIAPQATPTTSSDDAAIYRTSGRYDKLVFRNNTIDNCSQATYIGGSSSNTNGSVVYEGNTVTNSTYDCVYFFYFDEVMIKGNSITMNASSFVWGMTIGNSTANATDIEVVDNQIVMNNQSSTSYGIYIPSSVNNGGQGLIANNMISVLSGSTGATAHGIHCTSAGNLNIYHNSVLITGGSTTNGRGMFFTGTSTGAGNFRVINNSAANMGGGYAIYVNETDPGYINTMNFNNWYTTGTAVGNSGGTPYSDLAEWQTGTSLDGISVSADPKYTSDTDLHANSLAIDSKGIVGTGITTDIDGDVRCPGAGCPGGASAPDLGADEFEVPPIDLIPASLVSPTESGFGCNQSASEAVIIKIANNGSQTLDFSVNPATIRWTAGGQADSAKINSGTLNPGESQDVTAGTIDLSVGGVYTFDLTATVQGDLKTSNDNLDDAGTIVSRDPINTFPYVEDFNSFPTCGTGAFDPCPLPSASGWTNESSDDFDWLVSEGPAGGPFGSTNTGPNDDFSRGGRYLYTETSSGNNGNTAIVTSPCIELPTNPGACPFMTFAYHMAGATMGSLEVQVNDGTSGWQTEFFASGPQQASEDDPWRIAAVSLSGYSGTIRVRFLGRTGSSFTSDMAIDEFSVVDGSTAAQFTISSAASDACATYVLENTTSLPSTASQWLLQGTPGVDYEFVSGTNERSRIAEVRFMDPGQKSISLLVTTVCGRSFNTQTTMVDPGVAKFDFAVSSTRGYTNCDIFNFENTTPHPTSEWTWGVRKSDNTTGRVGVDYVWMNNSERRDEDVSIMFLKPGIYDVEFYANAGCDNGKAQVVKQLEVLSSDPGPVTTDDNLTAPGMAVLTATAARGTGIEWYDAPEGGNLVATGDTLRINVASTTSYYAQETNLPTAEPLLLITETGGPGQNDDQKFVELQNVGGAAADYTGWRVALASWEDGSGINDIDLTSYEIQGVINPGEILQIRALIEWPLPIEWWQADPGWVMLLDENGVVQDFMIFNFSTAQLNTLNLTVPGTDWNITRGDVPWVGDPIDGDFWFRVRQGNSDNNDASDWISEGNVSGSSPGTGSQNAQNPGLTVPFPGGCPSSRTAATAFVGGVPPLAIVPSKGQNRRTADWSVVEGPWTHYYDNNGTPNTIADDYRLISLRLGGQNIGTIGDGTFQLEMASTPNAGTGYAVDLSGTAGYLGPNQGAVAMNRYWNVTATNQPTQAVGVRFYYNDEDVVDLNATLIHDLDESPVDHTLLAFNKIATNEDPDPTKNGHSTVEPGEYINIVHGNAPSTSTWVKGAIRDFHYAEFEVNSFSGGTGGVANGLTGGSLPVELVDFKVSQVANTALLEWTSATEINTEVYEIERSVDGAVFEVIGQEAAAGNSQTAINYNFTDGKPVEGRNYYRLRMVDADGSFGYSEVRTLTFEAEALTLSAYPNPFTTDFTVTFTTEQQGAVQISLFDAAGKQIHSQKIEDVIAGVNTAKIQPASDLTQGVYIMTMTQNGVSQRLQLIKQ
jgi:hypothetical protein